MSDAFRSAVALRNDLCATLAELEQRYSRPLPDGASVYVTEVASLYRLAKGVGAAFDAIGGDLIVTPVDGSTNRWLQQEANGGSPWSGTEILTNPTLVTPSAQAAWTALGSTPGTYALSSGQPGMFAVSPTTGLLTYNGPTRLMTASYQLSGQCGSAVEVHAALSLDGDIAPGDTSEHRGFGEQAAGFDNDVIAEISGQRQLTLHDADTLRLMIRNITGAEVIEVDFFALQLAPT